jgi:iron complex outermembrane receptor protein
MDGRWMPATADLAGFAELRYQDGPRVAAIELRHLGRRFANDLNTLSAPAFHTWAIRWQQSFMLGNNQLTAIARIDNLLDQRYVGSLIVNNSSPFEPSPGRTAWVGLRLRLPAS